MPIPTLASIPLSLAKPYMKLWNRGRYDNIFNKYGSGSRKDRIYIPFSGGSLKAEKAVNVSPLVEQELAKYGYEVADYKIGLAVDKRGRQMRIGKIIKNRPDVKKVFDNDSQRAASKMQPGWVVISRHPYDIIGMSFDRGWTSCVNLKNGQQRRSLKSDIKYGTLVAYLLKNNDRNINSPLARIALRPAFNDAKQAVLMLGPVYGTASPQFSLIVRKFVDWANSGSPNGRYHLQKGLYYDMGMNTPVTLGPIVPERQADGSLVIDPSQDSRVFAELYRVSDLQETLDLLLAQDVYFSYYHSTGSKLKLASKYQIFEWASFVLSHNGRPHNPDLLEVLYDRMLQDVPRNELENSKAILYLLASNFVDTKLQLRILREGPPVDMDSLVERLKDGGDPNHEFVEELLSRLNPKQVSIVINSMPSWRKEFTPATAEYGLRALDKLDDQIKMLEVSPNLLTTSPALVGPIFESMSPSRVLHFLDDVLAQYEEPDTDRAKLETRRGWVSAAYAQAFSKAALLPALLRELLDFYGNLNIPPLFRPEVCDVLNNLPDAEVAALSKSAPGLRTLRDLIWVYKRPTQQEGLLLTAYSTLLKRVIPHNPALFMQITLLKKSTYLRKFSERLYVANQVWPEIRESVLGGASTEWEDLCQQMLRSILVGKEDRPNYPLLFKSPSAEGLSLSDDFAVWVATSATARATLIEWSQARSATKKDLAQFGKPLFQYAAKRLQALSLSNEYQRLQELSSEVLGAKG